MFISGIFLNKIPLTYVNIYGLNIKYQMSLPQTLFLNTNILQPYVVNLRYFKL